MIPLGNHKPPVALTLLISILLQPVSIVADDKQQQKHPEKWDMDFFVSTCPGAPLLETNSVDVGSVADITADEYEIPAEGVVSFKGKVKLQQGEKVLNADLAHLNKGTNTFKAKGNIYYQDTHVRLTADVIDFDTEGQTGKVGNSKFQLTKGTLRGQADEISLQENHQLSITNVGVTSCPPGNESWLFQSAKIDIDPNTGRGEAEDVVLRINDYPVFYLPSFSFPVDDRRQSGFLYPSIGTSSRNGLELDIPWYWNIATDKDATFYARYLSKRGLMLGAEYRQMTEHTENEVYAEYLGNDSRGLAGNTDRFFYQLHSKYAAGESWRGNLDLSSVSDDDYFFDFGGNSDSGNRNYLRRFGQISFNNEHLSFTGLFSNDQILSTPEDPYSRLPQLRLSLLYPQVASNLTANLHMEATAFRRSNTVEAERLAVIPELNYPMHWNSGYIKPKLKFHYSHYSQNDPTNVLPDTISRSLPIFSVDSAMFFDRPFNITENSFIQTLEPRLFYLYVPSREQGQIALFDTTNVNNGVDSLFRENRYSGIDRIGDSNQLSLAVTSRFYEQETGRERLRLTVGRAYYLEHREVNLAISQSDAQTVDLGIDRKANSALITNLHLGLYDHWWLKGELEYDGAQSRTEKGVLGLHYSSPGLILNLKHRINRFNGSDDIEQSEVSFSWTLSENLSFVGRWQQDLRNNRTIDSFAGLEYEDCCWAVRLVARHYLNVRLDRQGVIVPGTDEFNNGIYLEFILKGLTNIGNALNLERDIQGYKDRFENY